MRWDLLHRSPVEPNHGAVRLPRLALLLLLTGIFCLWPRPVAAQDTTFERWVQPGGDDGNQCIRTTVPPDNDDDPTTYEYQACATIARALAVAQPGDIIRIAGGTYSAPLVINKPVTLIGGYLPGFGNQIEPPTFPNLFPVILTPGNVTISGLAAPNVPMQVTLKGITIQAGLGLSIGSNTVLAFPFNRVAVTLEDVKVLNNVGLTPGGGIDISGTDNTLRILKSTISGNNVAGDGGGIYVGGGARLTLDDKSILHDNSATGNGGGLAAVNALTSTVSGGITITANSAAYGGGVYLANSRITLGGDTFILDNNATTSGGGIYANGGAPLLENLTLALNRAPSGGGIALNGVNGAILRGSSLLTNTATSGAGGGFYVNSSAIVTLTSNNLQANLAPGNSGGGGVINNSGGFYSSNSYLANAAATGAGLYINNAPAAELSAESFIRNQATSAGGGLYLTNNNGTALTSLTFAENSAPSGGGLYATANPRLELVRPEFTDNRGSNGAGFYALNSTLNFTGATLLQDNSATGDGGAGYLAAGGIVTVATLDLLGNAAVNGAGIYANGGRITVTGAGSYIGNQADNAGGVFYFAAAGGTAGTLLDSFAQNNEALSGGALYATSVAVTLGRLTLQGNEARGDGGGLALQSATLTITGTAELRDNRAGLNGGGLFADNSSVTFVRGVQLQGNGAQGGNGGGLYLRGNAGHIATLNVATLTGNVASGAGGGLYLAGATLLMAPTSALTDNTAQTGNGGGLFATGSSLTLTAINFTTNQAGGSGGALYLSGGTATLTQNNIGQNRAGSGAGLYFDNTVATLNGGAILDNSATGGGGGFYATGSQVALTGADLRSNEAGGEGGGAFLSFSRVAMTNTLVTRNRLADPTRYGAGIWAANTTLSGLHLTLSDNRGLSDQGVAHALYAPAPVAPPGGAPSATNVNLVNSIVSGPGSGLNLLAGNSATLNTILWNNARFDWTGDAIFSVTGSKRGDPRFVAPASGDYRLRRDSAAFDQGIATALLVDRAGVARPQGFAPDLGAHEQRYSAGLYLSASLSPTFVKPGDVVTIQVRVRNPTTSTATGVNLSLLLPAQLAAQSISQGSCQNGVCTVPLGSMSGGTEITLQLNARVVGTPSPAGLLNLATNIALNSTNFTTGDTTTAVRALLHSCRAARGPTLYPTVQAAVDAAAAGETIRISGTCGDFHRAGGPGQLLTLNKNVTLQGGWNSDFTRYDPATFPTTLDAGGQGRVIFLPAGVSPTLQTLVLRGGTSAGLGGGPAGKDAGGGLYSNNSTPTLQAVEISANSSPDLGGGLYIAGALPTFTGGTIRNNGAGERGGGLYIDQIAPTLSGVAITGNSARAGGGVYLDRANAQFLDTAPPGGTPTCRIDQNTTSGSPTYQPGGGLPVLWLAPGGGGGLALDRSAALVRGCSVNGNTARVGGGIYLHNSAATLENSQITANRAQTGTTVLVGPGGVRDGDGGGLLIDNSNPATLIVRGLLLGLNRGTRGSALLVRLGQSGTLALPHLTVNSNSGGPAVVALGQSDLALRDTILAFNTGGPATFAQNGPGGEPSAITLQRTLWHPAEQTRSGSAGGTVTTTDDFTGDPAFRNDGYHLKRISFAYGVGATAASFPDRDGNLRPTGSHAELGADEYADGATVRYVAVGGPGSAPCTDYQNPCATLQTALDAATDGDLIKLAGGTYSGVNASGGTVQHARIAKRVTIQGGYFPRTDNNTVTDRTYTVSDWEDPHPDENPTILDVANQGRIFYITGNITPTLAFLTLRRGNATGLGGGPTGSNGDAGGAIYVDGAAPTFHNVSVQEARADLGAAFYLRNGGGLYRELTLENNGVAGGRGGGFYIFEGAPTLQSLTIRSNVAITGAGLYLDNTNATLMQNRVVENGSAATLDGGGLYAIGGAPTLITNTFSANRSAHGGGARLDNSGATLRGNTFSGNRAGDDPAPAGQSDALGGALYLRGGAPQILDNLFADNRAVHPTLAYGGALYLGPSGATLSGNILRGNQAHRGAGVYAAGSGATLTGNSLEANLAQAPNADLRPAGGGLFLAGAALTVTHNSLVQNQATFGGGLYLSGSGGYVYSNTVADNRAEQAGGGLYLDGSNALVQANLIEGNRALQGNGGGLAARNGQATLSANLIRNNLATLGGGGIYLDNDGSTLAQMLIQANGSADGGGIYVNGPPAGAAQAPPLLEALDLRDNLASNHGGALYAANSTLTLRRSSLRNNQAAVDGGGVYLVGAAPTDFSANLIAQNRAGDDGGGLFVGRGTTGRYASNAILNNQAGQGGGILVEGATPTLVHTTLANNGIGLVVVPGGPLAPAVILTNTIIAGHTLGIQAASDASVTLFQTLWDNNGAKFAGPGTVIGNGDLDGAAAFAPDGYHLTGASAAVGRGLSGAVAQGNDIDGDGRFQGNGPELGADELGVPCAAILAGIPTTVYSNLQQAVDAAPANGEVRVAGTCTGVTPRAGGTQLLYIAKNVTVRGGYSLTNWETATPLTQPTLLDAGTQGRVVRVAAGTRVTLVGLTLLNGNAAGQGGGPGGEDAGGALYADDAQLTLARVSLLNNRATVGGAIYLQATTATLTDSTLHNNTAAMRGGALYLRNAPASVEVRANDLRNNRAPSGGAIYLDGGAPLVQSNLLFANGAIGSSDQSNSGRGGGIYAEASRATLSRNRFEANRADLGGALYIAGGAPDPTNNLWIANVGTVDGGAIYSVDAPIHLRHNTLSANRSVGSSGSAIVFAQPSAATAVALTNNILVDQSRAISVSVNINLNLRANLWFNNGVNWAGPGTVVEGAGNLTLAPGFVNAGAGNFQLRADSPAVDRGINIGVFDDLMGRSRPARQGFDIGAYEYLRAALNATLVALPDPVAAGGQQRYLAQVLNIGDVDLVATVQITLPRPLTALGPVVWENVAIARGASWTGEVTARVAADYTGPLVAALHVTSDQDADAIATVTSTAAEFSAEVLSFAGESFPNPAPPGSPVELRIRLTNAGGVPLQTRIVATLPPGLSTEGPRVFTPTLAGPDGAWATQMSVLLGTEVTAGTGARPNQLITTFEVTSDQGLGGTYQVTTEIARPGITVQRVPLSPPAVAGATLVYGVGVTNTGNVALVATISNTFPAQVAVVHPADAQPWQIALAPGEVYRRSVSTTVEAGYRGPLVGSIRVTTDAGVTATAQDEVAAAPPALLPSATAKGGDWYRADSWEPPSVPPEGAFVLVPEGVALFSTRPITVAGLIQRGRLELRNGAIPTQSLRVTGALENYGEILGTAGVRSDADGLTLNLSVGTLYNVGVICAGDGAVNVGAGGDLNLTAGASTNLGLLCAGHGADGVDANGARRGGRGGDIFLAFDPGLLVNRGKILAGNGGNSPTNATPPIPGGDGGDITLIATAAARLGNSDVKAGTGGQGSKGAASGALGSVVVGAPEINTSATRFSEGPVLLLGLGATDVDFSALAPVAVTVSPQTGVANFSVRIFNRSAQADTYVITPQATPNGWVVNNLPATIAFPPYRTNSLPVVLTLPREGAAGAADQPFAVVITSQRNAARQIVLPLQVIVAGGGYQLRLPIVQQ